jgi:hypothetical protein
VRTEWSIHPAAAIETTLPVAISGLPFAPEVRQALSEGRPPFIYSAFMGPLVLPLALGLWFWPGLSRGRRAFLGIGCVGSLLVAMGKFTPAYDALLLARPPLAIWSPKRIRFHCHEATPRNDDLVPARMHNAR